MIDVTRLLPNIVRANPELAVKVAWARAAGEGVLVCCGGGAGRSATLYAAWLMAREERTLDEAIELLQRRRPRVAPTRRQIAALESWATALAPRSM